jgi:hypothetical protein
MTIHTGDAITHNMTPREIATEITHYQFLGKCMTMVALWNLEDLVANMYDNYGTTGPWIKEETKRRCIDAQTEAATHYATARQLMGLGE